MHRPTVTFLHGINVVLAKKSNSPRLILLIEMLSLPALYLWSGQPKLQSTETTSVSITALPVVVVKTTYEALTGLMSITETLQT